jgi:flagellar biosynthesis protein
MPPSGAAHSSKHGRPKMPRAVALGGSSSLASGRGAFADAILAVAAAKGVRVRRDADLAEVLSALDPASDAPEAATALTAALLDRLYRMNAAAKGATPAVQSEGASNEKQ